MWNLTQSRREAEAQSFALYPLHLCVMENFTLNRCKRVGSLEIRRVSCNHK